MSDIPRPAKNSRDSDGEEQRTPIMLRQEGIKQRFWCSGQVARRIEDQFVTVEQLVAAVESDTPLTERDGIGSVTASKIENWYENRFAREERVDGAMVEHTGPRSAMIHNLSDWTPALGGDSQ